MEIGKFFLRDFSFDVEFDKRGGEAIVSKAWHPRLGHVAIKRWIKAYNVENEIKLLIQNWDHPNIIKFLGMLVNNESNYIGYIMPYMSMGSLHDDEITCYSFNYFLVIHNKGEEYDEKQVSTWITQICCGLSHLHFKKIIHRDIKPSNVLLGNCNDVKLSDLGMARSLNNITHSLTKGIGTKRYMAPEIFKGGKYDFSADIYSLSITIWEILHRKKPFDHVKCSNIFEEYELFNDIYKGKRPELNNNLSKEVSYLLMRCWHVDASRRPTINYVAEFFDKTEFLYTDLQNAVNECVTSLENLNVHSNDDESLTLIPPKAPVEKNPEKQTILLLGGDGEGSLVMLENNGQNWKELNIKLPYGIHGHGAQFLNNNLYIFGGCGLNVLNWTYKLSKSLRWEKMANMNQKRRDISNSSVVLNNQIWVCGGRYRRELKNIEMYDPLTNKWKEMKEMNRCRTGAVAAVVNGKIFCSGGWDGKNILNSIECYDFSSDVWTLISNMPQSIAGHGAVEINGNFVVVGSNGIWALNTTDKNAVWIHKLSMSISRKSFNIAKIHDKIFVCGGVSKDNESMNSVEIFDGEVWRNGPKLPTHRSNTPAVVIPMEFARKLVNSNIIVATDLNIHSNDDESLTQIPFKTSINESLEKQTILLLGGEDERNSFDTLLILGHNEQNWKQLNIKLPYKLHSHGAQFLNNSIYIFGGQYGEDEYLNCTYKLSKSLQWEIMANMNQKRGYISNSNVVLNNQIWVCGGINEDYDHLKSVEMYDPETNEWKEMKQMNERRSFAAATVVNGKIFCTSSNSVECYDPSSDAWTLISNMPQYIEGHCAVEMDEKLIIMGGKGYQAYFNYVWALDTMDEDAEWIKKPFMSIPRARSSIAKMHDKLFICGGYNGDYLDFVEIFDGEAWRDGPKLPTYRANAPAIVIPMGFLRKREEVPTDLSDSWRGATWSLSA